ncbi:hypothetical protein B0H10DRAFT_2225483 [Mycena sp. CBHHK59/15]|nr:hypothetical protein B0H10DRAFT_2225483 [Mycena sp. CBHHK59/15]
MSVVGTQRRGRKGIGSSRAGLWWHGAVAAEAAGGGGALRLRLLGFDRRHSQRHWCELPTPLSSSLDLVQHPSSSPVYSCIYHPGDVFEQSSPIRNPRTSELRPHQPTRPRRTFSTPTRHRAHPPASPSPLTSPDLSTSPLAPALLITPPAARPRDPRVPPPLPPRPVGHSTQSLAPPFVQAFPTQTHTAPIPHVPTQNATVPMSDLFFSGDRSKKIELSAANFLKRLNILYRDQSAADKWFVALKNTVPAPAATTDWAAFSTAFIARFKGADPVLKPRGQLEADLARMRIGGELAKGTITVRDRQVYALADFIERLDDAITEAGAMTKDVGLWDFHNALPAVLQDGVGARTADWAAMVTALKAIPQTKIDAAVASFKDREADRLRVDQLEKRFGAMQAVVDASSAVANEASKGRRNKGAGANGEPIPVATNEQKDQLRKVLTDCVGRRHPNTPAGLAAYAEDIRTWNRKYGAIARAALQLEFTGTRSLPASSPPAPTNGDPRARGTWLGRTSLVAPVPVQLVVVEPVVVLGPWYEDDQAEAAGGGEQDFVEGLQQ